MAATVLQPGANAPLGGDAVRIELDLPQFGGAAILVEADGQAPRLAGPGDAFASVSAAPPRGATVEIDLSAVPDFVARLRLLVWSPAPDLALARATATLTAAASAPLAIAGPPAHMVELSPDARELRAAELLELYRRGGAWKVRAVASGWAGHIVGMAAAVGLSTDAFPRPRPVIDPPAAAAPAHPRHATPDPSAPHEGPSPPVGPPALRDILDTVVGPGARFGDDTFVDFVLNGAFLRLSYERSGDFARLIAVTPAGEGAITDTVALAALRVTGEAPLARVSFAGEPGDESAFVSAPAVAHHAQVDSALVKALLSETWVTAHRFGDRVRTARWAFPRTVTEQVPRELRLGVAEALQDQSAWTDVRDRLAASGCTPLVDQPAAMLVPAQSGQLAVGPALLAGTPRGWTIIVERTVRSNVRPEPGLWTALGKLNAETAFVRFGVQAEGLPGDPPAILVGFSALQLPRTQVVEDLARGLDLVDEAADHVEPMLHGLAPDSADFRNNLPWTATRRWTGPGTEITTHLLIREVAGLDAGAPVPAELIQRVRGQAGSLGRPGTGYLAHLALLRAEARDAASEDWKWVAREIVALVPVTPEPGDEPSAAASVHVRMGRLDAPRPMRPPPPPPRAHGAPAPAPRRRGLFG